MAQGNFDPCFNFTIGEEGRYSDTPRDPGNWSSGRVGIGTMIGTCWGISAPTLIAWMGDNAHLVTPDYMRALPIETAKDIYKKNYWDAMRCDELPVGIDLAVWDFGVNAGPAHSIAELLETMGLSPTATLDDTVINSLPNCKASDLINDLIDYHDWYYHRNRLFSVFGAEWLARQERLKKAALAMAEEKP